MFRRIVLALAFVIALSAAGVGLLEKASAHDGWFGSPLRYGGSYGGYGVAAYRLAGPGYYPSFGYGYGYPVIIDRSYGYRRHGHHDYHHGHHGHGGISISFGF